jgi:hypothetical protein
MQHSFEFGDQRVRFFPSKCADTETDNSSVNKIAPYSSCQESTQAPLPSKIPLDHQQSGGTTYTKVGHAEEICGPSLSCKIDLLTTFFFPFPT